MLLLVFASLRLPGLDDVCIRYVFSLPQASIDPTPVSDFQNPMRHLLQLPRLALRLLEKASQPIRRRTRNYLYELAWSTDRWTRFEEIGRLIDDEHWAEARRLIESETKAWGSEPFLDSALWEVVVGERAMKEKKS